MANDYEAWIRKTADEIEEAIREAENASWHHAPVDSIEGRAYNRLLTWTAEIVERMRRIDGRR